MRLHWATDYRGEGNSFGYAVHNAETRAALEAAGVVFRPDAPTAFHVASPLAFRPVPGKRNVLYVAWETDRLPDDMAARIRPADLVFVTAEWLVPVFRAALPGTPIRVAHLGVRARRFPFARRRWDKRKPFRYLWVGAPNARKGYELVLGAWSWFAGRGDVELYLKTTVTERRERAGNVVFDSRRLPADALARLYAGAHAFVFPSFGEGFGLTMAEAMATGLPCIHTGWSALAELADRDCAYPLDWEWIETPLGRMAQADIGDLVVAMERVRRAYPKALRKGRRAAARIRERFTWERTAQAILAGLRTPAPNGPATHPRHDATHPAGAADGGSAAGAPHD